MTEDSSMENISNQISLFEPSLQTMPHTTLKTEAIKYIGSKKTLLKNILHVLDEIGKQSVIESVLDGFSGSSRVSQALAWKGFSVYSNDIAPYSRVFAECYLNTKKEPSYYQNKIDSLNNVKGERGFLTTHYGGNGANALSIGDDSKKKMWQYHNTMKADAMLKIIHKEKDDQDKAVLLTSLMLALDKVDSSLGHQSAYLREWSARSYKNISIEVPQYTIYNNTHKVFATDIFSLIRKIEVDVAYFDPPYCSNNEKMPASRVRYGSYYHIWKTICLNDSPELFGACNRRVDSRDSSISVFEDFRKDAKSEEYITTLKIKELIESTRAKFILFSYSNNGRTDKKSLIKIFHDLQIPYLFYEINYKKNVMYSLQSTQEYTNEKANVEYWILLDKTRTLDLNKIT